MDFTLFFTTSPKLANSTFPSLFTPVAFATTGFLFI